MKKIVAYILTVVLLLSTLGAFCFAATSIAIKTQPAVFLCGKIYNIVWTTTLDGTGYVEYTIDGKTHRVYDEEGGIVRTDDYIHSVSVPVEHLDAAGGYTVTSVEVTNRGSYSVTYGSSCSATRTFTGYHNQEQINIWTASDIHRTTTNDIMNYVNSAASHLKGGDPDVIVLNGDIANDVVTMDYIEIGVFDTAAQMSGGTIPVLYVRGNHETRGSASPYFLQYLPSDTGEFYFTFEYGPMSSIVLDFGEDKEDSHYEYSGLVDYTNYRINQNEWITSIDGFTGTPTYRIAFCHGPELKKHFGYNWTKVLSNFGADLLVGGHSHAIKIEEPGTTNTEDFHVIHDGGNQANGKSFAISQILLQDGVIEYYGVNDLGEEKLSGTITAGLNVKTDTVSASEPESESVSVPTAYGAPVSTVVKGASPDFAFITKPTVFDTGDAYTVAWATTDGVNSSGEVYVEYNGSSVRFTDSESGTLRTQTNVHAVRIPKKYLDGNKYTVISQHIIRHGAYHTSTTKGNTVSTPKIQFTGYSGQQEINMLYVSDLNSDSAAFARAKNVASGYDMLVLGGNTVNHTESSSYVVQHLLFNTGVLTSGKIPVGFVRGENETTGEYAPYLTRIIRNSTRQFYETLSYGPVTATVLDTSGLYDDDNAVYNSLASFDSVYEKQLEWLKDSSYGDAQYKIAFTRVNDINGIVGANYVRYLNTLGTDLLISSYGATTSVTPVGNDRNFVSLSDGSFAKDGSVATMLTFKDGTVTVKTLGENGTVKSTETVNTADNDAVTYSDVSATAWYADAVSYAAIQRTMVGTSATDFSPETNLNRAMAVTVLGRLAGISDYNADTPFTDTVKDSYYASAVKWAYANGIVLGTSATTFSPDVTLTREQLVTLLYRMYGDTIESVNNNTVQFTDFSEVSDFAKEAVTVMSGAGILEGVGNNMFAPKKAVSRAELAQVLYKSKF